MDSRSSCGKDHSRSLFSAGEITRSCDRRHQVMDEADAREALSKGVHPAQNDSPFLVQNALANCPCRCGALPARKVIRGAAGLGRL